MGVVGVEVVAGWGDGADASGFGDDGHGGVVEGFAAHVGDAFGWGLWSAGGGEGLSGERDGRGRVGSVPGPRGCWW